MDNQPTESNPPPEQQYIKPAPSLKVELAGFGFVVVALILLFGILNYFNILSISDVFPKYFSWLPRQRVSVLPQPITQSSTGIKTTSSVPDFAKKDLTNFADSVIVPSSISTSLLEKNTYITDNNNTYATTTWNINGNEFKPTIKYGAKNALIDKQLLLSLSAALPILDASIAPSIAEQYLTVTPQTSFSCVTLPISLKTMLCESFWQDTDGTKKGIDIISPIVGNKAQVFYCERTPQSPDYAWQSCNTNFQDTGVK